MRTPASAARFEKQVAPQALMGHDVCFGVGSRRRSAPQVSDLIDTEGVARSHLFTSKRCVLCFKSQLRLEWRGQESKE